MKRFHSTLLHGLLLAVLTLVPVSVFSSSPTGEQYQEAKVETMQSGIGFYYGGGPYRYRSYGYGYGYYPYRYYSYPYYSSYSYYPYYRGYYPGYSYYWW